jgi:hypothetical protein
VPEITLDPLVGRVRDAIRDVDLSRPVSRPSFEDFSHDLRHMETPKALDQLAKAVERVDLPKVIQQDLPKAVSKLELPDVIEQRLPGRRRRNRLPLGLFGLLGAAALVATTIALTPPIRRRLRGVMAGAREQWSGMRGEQHWSKGAGLPVAFPQTPTAPLQDDPDIPGEPAPYPSGLGDADAGVTPDAGTAGTLTHDYLEASR